MVSKPPHGRTVSPGQPSFLKTSAGTLLSARASESRIPGGCIDHVSQGTALPCMAAVRVVQPGTSVTQLPLPTVPTARHQLPVCTQLCTQAVNSLAEINHFSSQYPFVCCMQSLGGCFEILVQANRVFLDHWRWGPWLYAELRVGLTEWASRPLHTAS